MVAIPPVTGPRTKMVATNSTGVVPGGTYSVKKASPLGAVRV